MPYLIATLPLYRKYRRDITDHPLVDALRFNTITPLDDSIDNILTGLIDAAGEKPLWLDLKARQIRITEFDYIPDSYVRISHKISVKTPTRILFKDCDAIIEKVVGGDRLILTRPARVAGKGEPVNIPDESLKIEGFLTDRDRAYIRAFKSKGQHRYMLSFVHSVMDFAELVQTDPDAEIIAKIEDRRGLDFVRTEYPCVRQNVRLMAATDDLYINMGDNKARILEALDLIVRADPDAIAASRILTSVYDEKNDILGHVSAGDLAWLYMLEHMGYRKFMLSDEICRLRDVFSSVMDEYQSYLKYPGRASWNKAL